MISLLLSLICFSPLLQPDLRPSEETPYIIGKIHNQLGNQMFEVAATVSLALDHGAIPLFPEFKTIKECRIPLNYRNVFFRLNTFDPQESPSTEYHDDSLTYHEIPYQPKMRLTGYFQSEKYFKHHKEEILELLSPDPARVEKLKKAHKVLFKEPLLVAVHIRCYWPHHKLGWMDGRGVLPFLGFNYFKEAMSLFPDDAAFVIFSDNIMFCKKELSGFRKKLYFVDKQQHYQDLFLMSLCHHNIISNSTFSWWGAYLNKNPDKKVIAPSIWVEADFPGVTVEDIIPEEWMILNVSR